MADVMAALDTSYTRVEFTVRIPRLLDWEMGIEGAELSSIKQSTHGRSVVGMDDHIVDQPNSYKGMDERRSHHGTYRPNVDIKFDLIVRSGKVCGISLRLAHPSSCRYLDSRGSSNPAQSLDFGCRFLGSILGATPLDAQNPPVPFPHSTVSATVAIDERSPGIQALNPSRATYKLELVKLLRQDEPDLDTVESPSVPRPLDLTSLPRCIREDIDMIGVRALTRRKGCDLPNPESADGPALMWTILANLNRKYEKDAQMIPSYPFPSTMNTTHSPPSDLANLGVTEDSALQSGLDQTLPPVTATGKPKRKAPSRSARTSRH